MNDILSFVQELASRTGIKKVLYKMDDSASVKALDRQLTDAFHIFEVSHHVVENATYLILALRFNLT